MGSQTATSTVTVPERTATEDELEQIIMQLIRETPGQLGDLSALARGDLRASSEDRRLLDESIGAGRDIAERGARRAYEDSTRMVEEDLLGRGLDQSTISAITQALQGRAFQDTMANVGSQAQEQMATGMLQLPFQRAQTQMSANQILLQKLLGGLDSTRTANLNERLNQPTTTTQKPFDWGAVAGTAVQAGTQMVAPRRPATTLPPAGTYGYYGPPTP